MSPILFFIICFTCTGVGKIFLQINSAAVVFINILMAALEGLSFDFKLHFSCYSKNPKILDPQKFDVITLKVEQDGLSLE